MHLHVQAGGRAKIRPGWAAPLDKTPPEGICSTIQGTGTQGFIRTCVCRQEGARNPPELGLRLWAKHPWEGISFTVQGTGTQGSVRTCVCRQEGARKAPRLGRARRSRRRRKGLPGRPPPSSATLPWLASCSSAENRRDTCAPWGTCMTI